MNSDALWTVLATILLAMMLLDHGSAGYGVGEPFDGTTTFTQDEVMGGPVLGTSTKGMYIGDCIIQADSVNTLTLEVVEDFSQVDVSLDIA